MIPQNNKKPKNGNKSSTYSLISGQNRFVLGRFENVSTNIIEITEDKLKNILLDYRHNLALIIGWGAPLSILISAIATLSTASFNSTLGIEPEVWNALFILLIIGSGIWLIVILISLISKRELITVNHVIEKIKKKDCEE